MKGDFSRLTFDPKKHYSSVLQQQGRVQLDADWNEQQEIGRHHDEIRAADLVGPRGAPKAGGGFRIGRSSDNKNLTVSPGRFYVGGVACENELGDVTLTRQPDLRDVVPPTPGTHVVYLDVWERHVSPLEDPAILESALGGPDTATRTKTVWQVRHREVTDPAVNAKPELFGPGWSPETEAAPGELDARARPEEDPGDGRLLPPRAGYTRLENHLYRVEIHERGPRGTATFKWSRENASVAAAIEGASGNVLTVQSVGKDDVLGFARNQWVEVLEDGTELDSGRGELMRVADVEPVKREVTLAGTLPSTIDPAHLNDPARHPKLRRWDQSAGASGTGVPTSSQDPEGWISLESGVEVRFREEDAAGNALHYETGDYWLIPARTASGTVEWPPDPAPGPTYRPSRGIHRRYAALALVALKNDGTFDPPTDLRETFPAATDIEAADVGFDNDTAGLPSGTETVQEALDALARINDRAYTFVVSPTPGWEGAFEQIGDGQDANIYFQTGDYTANGPIVLRNKGNVTISGGGLGTRIAAPTSESVFVFENCHNVLVRDLYVESGAAGSEGNLAHLNGTLTINGCDFAAIEGVGVRCADAGAKAASCIRVDGTWTCRIQHCNLSVGHHQVGILLKDVQTRIQVMDNTVWSRGDRSPELSFPKLIESDKAYRSRLRRMLISHARSGDQPYPIGHQETSRGPVTVAYGGQRVSFRTPTEVVGEWARLVNRLPPQTTASANALLRHLEGLADRILLKDAAIMGAHLPFKNWYDQGIVSWNVPVMAQGVVVVGDSSSVINVLDNQIGGAVQGIHLGPMLIGGKVSLINNDLLVSLPASEMASERHGVFVGDCHHTANLSIENNQIAVERGPGAADVPIDGVRIYGHLGDMVTVRQNQLRHFTNGIFVRPLNAPSSTKPGWLVADNLASGLAPPGRTVVKIVDPLNPAGAPPRVRTRDNLP